MSTALWDETSERLWAGYLGELSWVGAYFYDDPLENSRRLDKANRWRKALVAHFDETGRHPASLSSIDRAALRERLVELAARPSVSMREEGVDNKLRRFVSNRAPRRSSIRLRAEPANTPDEFDPEVCTTMQVAMSSVLDSGGFEDAKVYVSISTVAETIRIYWTTPELGVAETKQVVARLTETVLATGIIDSASVSVTTKRIWESPRQADPARD